MIFRRQDTVSLCNSNSGFKISNPLLSGQNWQNGSLGQAAAYRIISGKTQLAPLSGETLSEAARARQLMQGGSIDLYIFWIENRH